MSLMKIEVIDRRHFMIMAGASASMLAGLSSIANAKPDMATAFIKKITAGAKPSDGKIKLEMPEIAENGATVPVKISVETAMSAADNCKAVHLVSTKNPAAHLCSFHFTPRSGKARAAIRVRMAKTQEVIALAEMSDGKWYMTKTTVKVTIGGCGG